MPVKSAAGVEAVEGWEAPKMLKRQRLQVHDSRRKIVAD
jgi:hypothetical protein